MPEPLLRFYFDEKRWELERFVFFSKMKHEGKRKKKLLCIITKSREREKICCCCCCYVQGGIIANENRLGVKERKQVNLHLHRHSRPRPPVVALKRRPFVSNVRPVLCSLFSLDVENHFRRHRRPRRRRRPPLNAPKRNDFNGSTFRLFVNSHCAAFARLRLDADLVFFVFAFGCCFVRCCAC